MSNEKTTALVTKGSVGGLPALVTPIAEIGQLRDRIEAMNAHAIVLCPFTSLDSIPAGYEVSERVFVPNRAIGKGDVYRDTKFCSETEVSLSKNGILGAWLAAGGSVLWSRRADDRSQPHYWEWDVMLKLRQIDGNEVTYPAHKELDLRDGSVEIANRTPKDVANLRKHGAQMCETKALLRAMRGIMKLKQKYELEELQRKPIVTYALVPAPDMSDPETRRIVTLHSLGIETKLYGPDPSRIIDVQPELAQLPSGEIVERETGRIIESKSKPAQAIETTVVDADPDPLGLEGMGEPPAPEPVDHPEAVCGCPCGHQKEVSKELAEYTEQKCGSRRCRECFPWNGQYKLAAHLQLKSLELKSLPKLDGQSGALAHKEWAETRKAGGGR